MHDEQRVAVGRAFRDDVGADRAARSGAVVDNRSLAEAFSEPHGDEARRDVVAAARRERHDEPHGLGWILIRNRIDGNENGRCGRRET